MSFSHKLRVILSGHTDFQVDMILQTKVLYSILQYDIMNRIFDFSDIFVCWMSYNVSAAESPEIMKGKRHIYR